MTISRHLIALVIASSSMAAAADERIAPFLEPGLDVTEVPHQVFEEGAFLLGGRTNVWPGAPDFLLRMDGKLANWPLSGDGTPKFYARSAILSDIGDSPDLVLRRAGPDNSAPDATPAPLEPGANIGTLYWQGWGGRCKGDPHSYGFNAGCGNNGRNAAIYARAIGEQSGHSRAGSLHFATTPKGNPGEPIVRIEITADGEVLVNPDQNPMTMRIRRPQRNGETAFLTAFKANGRVRIDRVEVDAPNSCGKGYRCLRINN